MKRILLTFMVLVAGLAFAAPDSSAQSGSRNGQCQNDSTYLFQKCHICSLLHDLTGDRCQQSAIGYDHPLTISINQVDGKFRAGHFRILCQSI